jgi:hypothetical protein
VADGLAAALTELAGDLAARDRPDRDPDDLPIVVLWGARGSESSELLAHLHTIREWPAPRAHLDGEQLLDELRPHLVANRLAFQLGRQVERFGRARFPRFFLGMQAVRRPLDPDAAPEAREARRRLLRRYLRNRSDGRRWLRESAQAIAGLSGVDAGTAEALGLAVDGAIETGRTLALLRGAGLRWYEDGLGRHFADATDALVELSVAEFLEDHGYVDRVLCDAFLADLRGEFASGAGRFYVRRRSALVLLDNIGTPAARRFLTILAARPSGPLLVVAASHQRFPDAAAEQPARWQPDDLGEASREQWMRQRAERDGSRYYPVWVDPIDDVPAISEPRSAEVEEIARQQGLRPAQYPAVAFARRLTAAHPAGMEMVFRSLRAAGGIRTDGTGPDLQGIFALRPDAGEVPLDDAVFDLVLGPWPEDMGRALALMGIAVDLSDASISPILATENQQIGRLITEFRERDLWVSHRVLDGRADPPRLHPFARRAIAHRLGRGSIAGLGWDTAHALLRDAAAARGDKPAELYHDLALSRIGHVAAGLSALFEPEDPRSWYDLLLQVTRAPLARFGHADTPNADSAKGTAVSGQLVAALQLHTDPLGDPIHDMCGVVTDELGELSRKAGTGRAFLLAKSQDFADCWGHWHRR